MITFKQFIEAKEVKDIPQNTIRSILFHINNPILCVKFALYCAEDCFQFNNEQTRPVAQKCIDLVKKWLNDPRSVPNKELHSVFNLAFGFRNNDIFTEFTEAVCAAGSLAFAAYLVNDFYQLNGFVVNNIVSALSLAAMSFAYASGHQQYTPEWNRNFDQKLEEYIRKLKGFTTTRSGSPTSIEPLKGYDNDYVTIMAALDSLEEIGEIGKEHFFYQDGNEWVFDLGHDNILRADSREELARLIHNDRYYLSALMRLYNANI